MNESTRYGSDLIVDILKQQHIDYVACNPGASFRGLHDSVVNYAQNKKPQLIMCCHEEISIAIAHGYAKASGKYMAVFVHSNIGLQHASMAIFNAWCDRVPILIIGGIGPLDTTKRRPWIDWIHTANNQDNIIRDYVKWCDQPYSLAAIPESLYRACRILNTEPKAPVYVAIDSTLQESKWDETIHVEEVEKYLPPHSATANAQSLAQVAELLIHAEFPVIITDYTGRNVEAVQKLIDLAEFLSLPVIDRGGRYNFPNNHPLCLTGMDKFVYEKADVILALDVQDLYGALGETYNEVYKSHINSRAKVIQITLSDYLISNWAADYHKLYPTDLAIAADSNHVLGDLYERCKSKITSIEKNKYHHRFQFISELHHASRQQWRAIALGKQQETPLAVPAVLDAIWEVIKNEDWMLTNNGGIETAKWVKKLWEFSKVGCYLGESGGAGLGYGLGASIGAALVYKDTDKLCINLQTDGDFLFTPSALWTVAHYQIPLLIIVMNNRSYGNSKEHAVVIANRRKREVNNAHIGTCMDEPSINFPLLARSFGLFAIDTIEHLTEIKPALEQAIAFIKQKRKPALIDIVIQ
jgi:acetolactate synthase-1/2/3 large subunit